MKIGMQLAYGDGSFRQAVDELADYERAGLQVVSVSELYSFDAVSQLGFIAARTNSLLIQSSILQIYTRTPTMTAMTAAGLDYVSGGRFVLGLGASGPQVVEGFHGVPYDAPLGRTREVIEICRQVWRRDRVEFAGRHYTVPLPADQGTGLGKALKLINTPVRSRIPVVIAATGPRNVELAAELAEGWQPIMFHPERAERAFGASLAAGRQRRDPALGPLQICTAAPLAIGSDTEAGLEHQKKHLALYVGGMGARGKNFYNDLAVRYGYEDAAEEIQDHYLAGRKAEATAAVPEEFARETSLVGTPAEVADRLKALAAAGVTTTLVDPLGATHAERVRLIEQAAELAASI